MNVRIRLLRRLYEMVRAELERPHAFAGERVGFLAITLSNAGGSERLISVTDYTPVADDRYINDPFAGARIDSAAIRAAMQYILDRRVGLFHVHMHPGTGYPWFSRLDWHELPRLVHSFRAVGPACAHGLLVLNEDSAAAAVWLPGLKEPVEARCISVVGYPLQFFGRSEL